jgi:hypothetical protein
MNTLAADPAPARPNDALPPRAGVPLGEHEATELAVRLIDARGEPELDHLIGAIMTHAAGRAGGMLTPELGNALGGLLKSIVRRGLLRPGPVRALGLELEGIDREERALEAALQFVRLAADAARHTATHHLAAPPPLAAIAALAAAADSYAPPLAVRLQAHGPRAPARRGGTREFELAIEPFEYDPEMEYFLGGLVRSATRAVGNVAKSVAKIGPVRDLVHAASSVARTASKVADAVGKIPVVGDVARAGLGAARLAVGPAAIAIDAGSRLARGENLGDALKGAVRGQIDAVRDVSKLAEMVAPFVPGVGQGVAAALGAANALAAGQPITEAVLAAARSAVPGGRIAQAAFDVAMNMAKGKNIAEAALMAARDQLPGGPAARAAFDGALALAQGKRLQDAAFAAAGRILPPSPYAADALSFIHGVANGQNVQNAALSVVGQHALSAVRANAAMRAAPLEHIVRGVGAQAPALQRVMRNIPHAPMRLPPLRRPPLPAAALAGHR